MPIGSSALSAECSQVRKICCALSAECTPELTHLTALHNAVVHCVWSWLRLSAPSYKRPYSPSPLRALVSSEYSNKHHHQPHRHHHTVAPQESSRLRKILEEGVFAPDHPRVDNGAVVCIAFGRASSTTHDPPEIGPGKMPCVPRVGMANGAPLKIPARCPCFTGCIAVSGIPR